MSPATHVARWMFTPVVVLLLLGSACSEGNDGASDANASDTVARVDPTSTLEGPSDDPDDGLVAFCAAVEFLDQTDGTTDDAVALEAFDELRRTAPAAIREDVDLVSDTMVINNYPSGVDPTMEKASIDEMDEAGGRVGAYVDEHCDLDV